MGSVSYGVRRPVCRTRHTRTMWPRQFCMIMYDPQIVMRAIACASKRGSGVWTRIRPRTCVREAQPDELYHLDVEMQLPPATTLLRG